MTDYRRDPVEQEAQHLTRMLDTGRQSNDVANALRDDSYNMNPRDFNYMVQRMRQMDNKQRGDNLEVDRAGNLIIDNGRQGFVVATQDFDERRQYAENHHRGHGRYEERGYDGRYGQPDAVTEGVMNGVIGAGVGAAIDGRKGALAGGIAGITNVIVDRAGGPNNRDDVTDVVVKGAIGAGVGAIVDGKKGAIAGGVGSAVPNILGKIFNKHE